MLADVAVPHSSLMCKGCIDGSHVTAINEYYHSIVYALHQTAETSIVKILCGLLKHHWIEELDCLKEGWSTHIFWHLLWVIMDHPAAGWLHDIKMIMQTQI
jgi:hypothetical protein